VRAGRSSGWKRLAGPYRTRAHETRESGREAGPVSSAMEFVMAGVVLGLVLRVLSTTRSRLRAARRRPGEGRPPFREPGGHGDDRADGGHRG
jgi:hypothetical protein